MESTCWFRCCEIGPSASGGAGGTPSTPCVEYVEHVEQPRIGNGNAAVGDLFGAAALRRQRVLFPSPVCRALHPPTAVLCATPQDAPGVGRRTLAFELFQRGSSSSVHLDSPLDCRRSSWIPSCIGGHAKFDGRSGVKATVATGIRAPRLEASQCLLWGSRQDDEDLVHPETVGRERQHGGLLGYWCHYSPRQFTLRFGPAFVATRLHFESLESFKSFKLTRSTKSPQSPRWYFCARFPSRHGVCQHWFPGGAEYPCHTTAAGTLATKDSLECFLGSKCPGRVFVGIGGNGDAKSGSSWLQIAVLAFLVSRRIWRSAVQCVLWLLARRSARHDWPLSSAPEPSGEFCGSWRTWRKLRPQRRLLGPWFLIGRNEIGQERH